MNYLLTENEALSFLNEYYNFDDRYIVVNTNQQNDKKETRGRKPLSYEHKLPNLYIDNNVILPAPFDDIVNGLIHVFNEEGNTRPYININKLLMLVNVIDVITVISIKTVLKCSNKTASRYYNFVVLLSKIYNINKNKIVL